MAYGELSMPYTYRVQNAPSAVDVAADCGPCIHPVPAENKTRDLLLTDGGGLRWTQRQAHAQWQSQPTWQGLLRLTLSMTCNKGSGKRSPS